MLRSLQLTNFRSHRSLSLALDGGLHVIRGPNGVGKTNALEAAYLLLNGRTVDGRPPVSCVTDGETDLAVAGDLAGRSFAVTAPSGAKFPHFVMDRKKVTRPYYAEHVGHRAVFFSNQELNVVYLEPQLRRDFLDEHLDLADSDFSTLRADYGKVVRSRNKLLAMVAEGRADPADLDFWDRQVAELGAKYLAKRRELAGWLASRLPTAQAWLGAKHDLCLQYVTKVPQGDGAAAWLLAYLRENRQRDVLIGRTCAGPHVDDLALLAGPKREPAAKRLSRGECKAAFLGLKFLAAQFVEARDPGRETVYLLDDLFSELDPRRCRLALDAVAQKQVLVTVQDGVFPDLERKFAVTDL